jgi:hypothetical protein
MKTGSDSVVPVGPRQRDRACQGRFIWQLVGVLET